MKASTTSYRYIVKTPGIAGGRPRIEGTRIAIHTIIGMLQNGESVDSICSNRIFPDLTRAQVYESLAFYEDHLGEMDLLIADSQTEESK
jgi:uncharacterized protein (DUF433 family)